MRGTARSAFRPDIARSRPRFREIRARGGGVDRRPREGGGKKKARARFDAHLVHLGGELVDESNELLGLLNVERETPQVQELPDERVTGPVPLVPVRAAALRDVRVVAVSSLPPFVGRNWAEDGWSRQADLGHANLAVGRRGAWTVRESRARAVRENTAGGVEHSSLGAVPSHLTMEPAADLDKPGDDASFAEHRSKTDTCREKKIWLRISRNRHRCVVRGKTK